MYKAENYTNLYLLVVRSFISYSAVIASLRLKMKSEKREKH